MEISHEDMNLAEQVFGLDVPNTKGKWVNQKAKVVSNEDVVELPPELDLSRKEMELDEVVKKVMMEREELRRQSEQLQLELGNART